MRTIYIGQAECAAFAATDSVSAKLGDQMEETEDMASYDVANKKLADAINQMSDKRSTGKLAKLEREAHVLAQELRAKTVVQEALDTVSSQLTAVKVRWNACLAGKLPEKKKLQAHPGRNWQIPCSKEEMKKTNSGNIKESQVSS